MKTKQKTIIVHNEKIVIKASIQDHGFSVLVDINGTKKVVNALVMKNEKVDKNFNEIFLKKAIDVAYVSWVKNNAN